MLKKLAQVAIPTRDQARAVAFYRDTLGLRLLFEAPPSLAFFDAGGVRLMLSPPEKPDEAKAGMVLYYLVDDIHAAVAMLKGRGAAFEDEPHRIARMPDHDLWMAFLRDSEGNLVGLMSEVRPPAP
jgi:methylmalonyl-CoA/ethylmalonyl-CoA epimerase